ncbi:tRNA-dihydrouridine(16/17) synthase [NAD(P)(+)] [Pleurotus pulmonarius]
MSTPSSSKLGGYDFYHQVLGSPKFIVAPMVDQSELPWRILSRLYGAQLVYTPMINAKMFYEDKKGTFRERNFNLTHGEEGGPLDRPLVIQFCANNPEALLASAKHIENHCDAVDINLGCPQEIAKRGRYGSFLQDDWELIYSLINTLHKNLAVPVTAKFRIFTSIKKTVEYAKMLERAGAQIITCHGRIREQRGQNTGIASWEHIKAVKDAVSIPVFANGNILYHEDIQACLDATGCDGVMSAEGQLYNAALFAPRPPTLPTPPLSGLHPRHADLALEYLSIVSSLKTPTSLSAIKGHLFKFMRPALSHEPDLREKLGRVRASDLTLALVEYREIVTEMKARMDRAAEEAEDSGKTWDELITVEPTTGLKILPHWLAQPYFRPLKSREPSTKLQQGAVSHDGEPLPSTAVKRARLGSPYPETVGDNENKRRKVGAHVEQPCI